VSLTRKLELPLALAVSGVLLGCVGDDTNSPLPNAGADAGAADATTLTDAGSFADAAPYVARYAPLDTDGHALRDAKGRTVILRGYNIKVEGLFDVTPDNGDPVRETIPPLDDTDFRAMQGSGVNVLRLPVNWSAFEPQKGAYQASYLAAIDAFLNRVRPYGFYVLLDFHEDGWSKDLCEDGAPAWATVVTTSNPDGGAPGADCHASNAALSAHANFFDQNANDLQGAFTAMYTQFAAHFAGEELVFGYEIFNEPISSDPVIAAFSAKVATAIRTVDARHLVLWEPSALRNQLDQSLVSSTPFPVDGCVYAVHVYTSRTASDWPTRLASSITNARTEADAWGQPLFITEHGADPSTDGEQWVDEALDTFDSTFASSMDWIWNPGVVLRDDAGEPLTYVFDGGVLAHLSRPYAPAIGGDVTSTVWNAAAYSLAIGFTAHAGVPATHDVFWPSGTPTAICDGSPASVLATDLTRHLWTFSCGSSPGAHTLVVRGPS
jgi:endoglycosylceramidase